NLEGGAQALRAPGDASPMIRLAPTASIFEEVGTFGGDRDVTDSYRRVNFVLGGGMSLGWPARSGRLVAHARCGFGLNDLMKCDAACHPAGLDIAHFTWRSEGLRPRGGFATKLVA